MLRQPALRPGRDRARRARSWIAGIKQEKARPQARGDARAAAAAVRRRPSPTRFRSAAAAPKPSIASLTRDDLVAFHRDWVRPDNATLVVVGDTTLAEIVPLLEKHLGDWKADGAAPQANVAIAPVALPKQPRVFLIDQPGAVQANIFVGQLMPSTKDAGAIELRHRQRACSAASSPRA